MAETYNASHFGFSPDVLPPALEKIVLVLETWHQESLGEPPYRAVALKHWAAECEKQCEVPNSFVAGAIGEFRSHFKIRLEYAEKDAS